MIFEERDAGLLNLGLFAILGCSPDRRGLPQTTSADQDDVVDHAVERWTGYFPVRNVRAWGPRRSSHKTFRTSECPAHGKYSVTLRIIIMEEGGHEDKAYLEKDQFHRSVQRFHRRYALS
jgi:hypothetical protein